jgi:hypothetical protein
VATSLSIGNGHRSDVDVGERGDPAPSDDRKRASGCFLYTAASDATARAHGQQFRIAPLLYAVSHPALRCNGGAHGHAREKRGGGG